MPYPETSLLNTRLLRPSWAEIDPAAIAHNVARAREIVGAQRRIWFVCKGDGFGFGAAQVARWAVQAGVDALCAGSPEEALAMRHAGIEQDILLFACTGPEALPALAALNVIVTLHSAEMVDAALALGRPLQAFLEIDCGFGRFGLGEPQWKAALRKLAAEPRVRLRGIYSHLSSPDDAATTQRQSAVFQRALEDARSAGLREFESMLASSRVMLLHSDLHHTAVDPGRLIYGALDAAYMRRGGLRPLLSAVRGRIIHVTQHERGALLGIGYGAPIELAHAMRIAIVPVGFWDGLNHVPPLGRVIVAGRYAPVVGRRSFQHTAIDVTAIPEAALGSEVTLLGRAQALEITVDELAETLRLPTMELIPRLARSLPHVHVHPDPMETRQ